MPASPWIPSPETVARTEEAAQLLLRGLGLDPTDARTGAELFRVALPNHRERKSEFATNGGGVLLMPDLKVVSIVPEATEEQRNVYLGWAVACVNIGLVLRCLDAEQRPAGFDNALALQRLFAALLLMPAPQFSKAYFHLADDVAGLAAAFRVTEEFAAARLAAWLLFERHVKQDRIARRRQRHLRPHRGAA